MAFVQPLVEHNIDQDEETNKIGVQLRPNECGDVLKCGEVGERRKESDKKGCKWCQGCSRGVGKEGLSLVSVTGDIAYSTSQLQLPDSSV